MTRAPVLAIGFLVVLFLLALSFMGMEARAQDHDAGHALHHDVYRTWLRPDTGTSCCSERKTDAEGHTTGDCRPTAFRLAKGAWEAQLDDGTWTGPLPEDKRLHRTNPDPAGVTGHLCEQSGLIYCWVPPTGAM